MDNSFDIPEDRVQKKPRRFRPFGCLLNIFSGILVAGTLVVGLLFAIIFINPQHDINPFPPTTMPALVLTFTPSPTPKLSLPETWTPTPSQAPIPTDTPIPTNTPEPTPEDTPIPTLDLEDGTSFSIQDGSPSYEENTVHPEAGCNWIGVAGQVFDDEGSPVDGVLVEIGGFLGEIEISGLTLTGMAPVYGEGGYEIILAENPSVSEDSVWIQLLDQANLPLSEKTFFNTFDSCDSNLIKINFEQVFVP